MRLPVEFPVGARFNRLTVVREAPRGKFNERQWVCVCACGTEKTITAQYVVNGRTESCGCRLDEIRANRGRSWRGRSHLPPGMAQTNHIWSNYKHQCKKNGDREFSLTKEQFHDLVKRPCFYCGHPPFHKPIKGKRYGMQILVSGIDRVDNSIGYVLGNCVPCCKVCNHAKHTLPQAEFIQWIERLVRFRSNQSFVMVPTKTPEPIWALQ